MFTFHFCHISGPSLCNHGLKFRSYFEDSGPGYSYCLGEEAGVKGDCTVDLGTGFAAVCISDLGCG